MIIGKNNLTNGVFYCITDLKIGKGKAYDKFRN
jgi:hypothetical protein